MSATNDSAITLVSPSVNGSIADERHPFAAHGLWLQVLLAEDFIDEMCLDLEELDNPDEVSRVKSGNFGHQVNSYIHLQTLKIRMRRLLMSRLIRIFTVCLFNLFFITIMKI